MITYLDLKPRTTYLHERILADVEQGDAVLDLGAGLASYHPLLKQHGVALTTVDAHEPYVARHATYANYAHHTTIQEFLAEPLDLFFDCALLIDVIEHLNKHEALDVLGKLPLIAEHLVIFTPRGFVPQTKDVYNLGGDYWQTHRSGWEPEEFELLGYDVEVWRGFHFREDLGKFDAIYATR